MLPTRSALEHKIHELLNYRDNEKIVWMGVPGPVWSSRRINKLSYGIMLVSCVIVPLLMNAIGFGLDQYALLPPLILVFVIGLMCAADWLVRRNIIYALTDRRAIMLFLLPFRRVVQVDLDRTPQVTAICDGKHGTVSFAGVHGGAPFRWFGAEAFMITPFALQEPVFFDVAEPEVVRDTALRLVKERDGQLVASNSIAPNFGHIFMLGVNSIILPVFVYGFVWAMQLISDPKFSMFPSW
jgi:hypothetical protein